MKKDILEIFEGHHNGNSEVSKVSKKVKEELIENGTRVFIDNEELYTKKIKFGTEDAVDKDMLESINGETVDFESMSDDEIWSYIYGEYILNGKISQIDGLGSTQVETY